MMSKPVLRLSTTLLALAAAFGCSRTGPAAPAARAWDWNAYPLETRLLVAQLPAAVVPVRSETLRAPVSGILHLLPPSRQAGPLGPGIAWAAVEPETSPLETEALDRARQELAERRARYRRYDQAADLDKLDHEISSARETLALARFAAGSPDLFAGDVPLLDPRLKPDATPAQAESRLQSLVERRRQVAAGDPEAEPADLQAMAASLEDRKRALDGKLASHPISAPIAGTLRLAVSPDSEGTHVDAGQVLATVEDDSALEVVVRATLPLLHDAPAERLACTVAASGGAEATATFSSWGVDSSGSGIAPVLRFRLPAGTFAGVRGNLSGVELPALVYVRLAAPARIVPKLALAQWDQEGVLAAGWRPGLKLLFPGSEMLAEGRSAVAIAP